MNKVDLSLVPIDELVDEIEKRSTVYILATIKIVEGNEEVINTYWSDNNYLKSVGLVSVLGADIEAEYREHR